MHAALVTLAASSMLASIAMAMVFAYHVRGERKAWRELCEQFSKTISDAYHHIGATPRQAAEGIAVQDYQDEALRQARVSFEQPVTQTATASQPATVRMNGQEYDVEVLS